MANWRSNFLKQLVGGDILKDYQHAARLYTDDVFRLAPKNQFLYHVVFTINPAAAGNSMSGTETNELGMIVKSCDLPSYQFNVELKNQYNFKNYSQTGITYQPVQIELHDDMGDIATAFFKSYYQHYIVDTNRQEGAYTSQGYGAIAQNRWGRDTGNNEPFFTTISIFQLGRKRFTEYKMMNPVVNDWSNGNMAQEAGTGLNSHRFSISYSGVLIQNGAVGADPQGFATFHYDRSPSPNRSGGDSIFGALTGATQTVSLLKGGNILGAALSAATTYEKIKSGRATRGAQEEIIGVAKDAVRAGYNNLGATSKPGVVFPNNIRKKSESAKIRSKQYGTVTANKPAKYKEVNGEIVLSPSQVSVFLAGNNNANTKVAKYVSFKNDKQIDVNDIETEWTKLSTTEKQTYLDSAANDAKKLTQDGVIDYTVDKDTYNKIVETA